MISCHEWIHTRSTHGWILTFNFWLVLEGGCDLFSGSDWLFTSLWLQRQGIEGNNNKVFSKSHASHARSCLLRTLSSLFSVSSAFHHSIQIKFALPALVRPRQRDVVIHKLLRALLTFLVSSSCAIRDFRDHGLMLKGDYRRFKAFLKNVLLLAI